MGGKGGREKSGNSQNRWSLMTEGQGGPEARWEAGREGLCNGFELFPKSNMQTFVQF